MRVLVVEDDRVVGDAVLGAFSREGFAVDLVGSAEHAKSAINAEAFDLAVVDIGLPREDGLQLIRDLRRKGNHLPVLMLTARDGISDRVAALDLGADDYLTKPFQVTELLARGRALLRRAHGLSSADLVFGDLKLELRNKSAVCAGVTLALTHREWAILECLALNAGRIVSKDKLLSAVTSWSDDITQNAVEVYVSRLRGKLGTSVVIRVIRGLGYRLDDARSS